jgi:hypothetical protein
LDDNGLEEITEGMMVGSKTKPLTLGEGEDICGRFPNQVSGPREEEGDQCGSYNPDRALFRDSSEQGLKQALEYMSASSAHESEMNLAGIMLKGVSDEEADAEEASEKPDVRLDIFLQL